MFHLFFLILLKLHATSAKVLIDFFLFATVIFYGFEKTWNFVLNSRKSIFIHDVQTSKIKLLKAFQFRDQNIKQE